MTMELKACPFCGGEPELRIRSKELRRAHIIFVECTGCLARTRSYVIGTGDEEAIFRLEKKATKAWNRRTEAKVLGIFEEAEKENINENE